MTFLLKLMFGSWVGPAAIGAAVVAGLVAAFTIQQQNIGAARAKAKIEAQNAKLAQTAKRAAGRSRDERLQGQRDPWTRDN